MKKVLFLLPFVIFLSCKPDKERILGHWHNLDYSQTSKFHTVDFVDSITIINDRMDISMSCQGKYQLNTDTVYFYICGQPDFVCYNFNYDTLLIDNERFVKSRKDSKNCLEVFLSTLKLKVQLTENKNLIPLHSVENITGNFSFGKMKELSVTNSDSFYIQVNHTVGGFEDMYNCFDAMEEAWEGEEITSSIMLTIDKNTPEWMIDSTVNMIQKRKIIDKIYKTCIDKKTGSIGLIELKTND